MDVDFQCLYCYNKLRDWLEAHPPPFDIDALDSQGYTALIIAAVQGDQGLLEWLIDERHADVNGYSSGRHLTPLHIARNSNIVEALLKRNADPTLLDVYGCTPLMTHIRTGNWQAATTLLNHRRVVDSINVSAGRSRQGGTALHTVCRKEFVPLKEYNKGQTEMVRTLLEAGANPFLLDADGCTPLDLLKSEQNKAGSYGINKDAVALLEEDERAWYLIRLRRLAVAKQGVRLCKKSKKSKKKGSAAGRAGNEAANRLLLAKLVGADETVGCPTVFTRVMDMLLSKKSILRKGLGE